MPLTRNFDYVVLDMIEQASRVAKTQPLNLGGIAGLGGGVGSPPGGFIGYLPQTRVAYDSEELASSGITGSGTLLDNLNHIRYRLGIVESGGAGTFYVVDDNTPATYVDVDTLHFSGAGVSVVDLGSGDIQITVSGGGGGGISDAPSDSKVYGRKNAAWDDIDGTYLRLDAANSPLVGTLQIYGQGNGVSATYLQGDGDAYVLDAEQYTVNDAVNSPVAFLYRQTSGTGDITAPLLEIWQDYTGSGIITGDFVYMTDVQTGKEFLIDKDFNVDIPSGTEYRINGIAHSHGWGSIDGAIASQSDLQAELDAKLNASAVSAFGLTLIDDADAATARTTLGLAAGGAGDIWVEKAGDTMTGDLELDSTSSNIGLVLKDSTDRWIIGQDTTDKNRIKFSKGGVIGTDDVMYIGTPEPSFTNIGGTGNRTSIITVTNSATLWYLPSFGDSELVDGSYSNYQYFANGVSVAGLWQKFDFGAGNAPVITGARWITSAASPMGVWQWQGSDDDSIWTDIGATFTAFQSSPDVQDSMSANTTGYRYYRMLGVSGTTNWVAIIYETEFKIDTTFGEKTITYYSGKVGFGTEDVDAGVVIQADSVSERDYSLKMLDGNGKGLMVIRNDGRTAFGYDNLSPQYTLDVRGSSFVRGSMSLMPLSWTTVTVTNIGTPGATTYSYYVRGKVGGKVGAPSIIKTTTTGNSTLGFVNYNKIEWGKLEGATSYVVYRSVGGATQGIIGEVQAVDNVLYLDDTGLTGDGSSSAYPTNYGTGWFGIRTTAPYAPLQIVSESSNIPTYDSANLTSTEVGMILTNRYQTEAINNTYLPNWCKAGLYLSVGNDTSGQRAGLGIFSKAIGGYVWSKAGWFVSESVTASVPSYAMMLKSTAISGGTAYGLYVDTFGGAGTNYAIHTQDGNVVLNESGSATSDLRVESNSYDALFIDASNDSIMLMSNAAGKVGMFGVTAIVQPTTAIAESTFTENAGGVAVNDDSTFDGYTIGQVVKALRNLGALA